jgi:hypothetical protein
MIELTEDQQQALAQRQEFPPRVVNPRTQETYVLIHAGMYERVQALLAEEDEIASVDEMHPLVAEALDAEESSPGKESATYPTR